MFSGSGLSKSSKPPASHPLSTFEKPWISICQFYIWLGWLNYKLTRCIERMVGPFSRKTQCLTNLRFGRTLKLIYFKNQDHILDMQGHLRRKFSSPPIFLVLKKKHGKWSNEQYQQHNL